MSTTLPKPKKNEYLVKLTMEWHVIVPAKEDGTARTEAEAEEWAIDMDPMDLDSQTGGPSSQEAEIIDDGNDDDEDPEEDDEDEE